MKKKMVLLFVVMAMVLSVVGCQSTTVDEKENNKPSVTKKEEDTQTEPGLYKPDGTFVSWEELTSEEYCTIKWLYSQDSSEPFETPILNISNGELSAIPRKGQPSDQAVYKILEGKLVVDSSVTKLAEGAFSTCRTLKEVVLPEGITEIPVAAFESCASLEKITVPSAVVSYGDFAFAGTGIEEFVIPDSVSTMGEYCFFYCSKLETVTIGASVTEIREGCFSDCDSLKKVFVSAAVQEIGSDNFELCENLEAIYCQASEGQVSWLPTNQEVYDELYPLMVWNATLDDFNK